MPDLLRPQLRHGWRRPDVSHSARVCDDTMKTTRVLCSLAVAGVLCLHGGTNGFGADPGDTSRAADVDDDLIIENNLFSPEREKWELQEKTPQKSPTLTPQEKKEIGDIVLYGTVITPQTRCAVLRADKRRGRGPVDQRRPYEEGDYIKGFLVAAIEPKRVVLRDEDTAQDFYIYISEEKQDRSAVKTEIKSDPQPVAADDRDAPAAGTPKKIIPRRAQTTDLLKKRVERSMRILKRRDSALVRKQVQRDLEKLDKLIPHMSEEDRREVLRLKQEVDKMEKE